MRLTRLHVAAELTAGTVIDLPPQTAAHVAKVLRAHGGDPVILFNGDGREYQGVIEYVRGTRVQAAVGPGVEVDREPPLAVTLVQCLPRGDRMDFIVQKATELGVRRIVPVLSQRSVVRLDATQGRTKVDHWRAVAINACEQCGRNRLPLVDAPDTLMNFLGRTGTAASRVLLDPEAPLSPFSPVGEIEVAVGPEGGFADEERDAFRLAGFSGIRLGPRILRSETAALVALAWLQGRFGDMSGAVP
ncbi:MAG: 16S rRNA (uracil(1498)-N(3))-methyltransferase [Steroidobacteraceae bacterium]